MSRARSSHATKSPQERAHYYDNVIQGSGTAPTLETVTHDTTDSAAPTDNIPAQYEKNPRHGPLHGLGGWFREHLGGVVVASLLSALIAGVGWLLVLVFDFNRDIGVQKQQITTVTGEIESVEKRLDSRIGALEKRIERAEDRHDKLLDSMLPKKP